MDANELLSRYFRKGILVDTNILLLYFVGQTNRERISRFPRTQQFTPEDYDLLVNILSRFSNIVTTPNILTEVNSFLNQIGEPDRSRSFQIFANAVSELDEQYIPSKVSVKYPAFIRFGLTDSGIGSFQKNQYLVLTDDLKLTISLRSQSIDVVNFNNIRTYNWN